MRKLRYGTRPVINQTTSIMTRINITIQDNKITYIGQVGDELPNPMWDELVASVTNIVERS